MDSPVLNNQPAIAALSDADNGRRADHLPRQMVEACVGLDSNGRVLEWNRAAVAMLGWTPEEAVGRHLTEVVGVCDGEHSDWALQELLDYAHTDQTPVVGNVVAHVAHAKDGSKLPVEVFVTAVRSGPKVRLHALIRDMTAVSETRTRQGDTDAIFKAVFDSAPIGIAVVGLDGSFRWVNQQLCRITGYDERELTQLTFQDITFPDDLNSDLHEATRLLHGEISSYQLDKRYYAKDGHLIWIHLSGSMVRDADGQPLHFIALVEDISARKRDEELLRQQATRDPLTGVLNRARFTEELARYGALLSRDGHEDEAAVFMIDLDGLKRINDQYGHAAGDSYIKSVAQIISRQLRLSDVFARIGGDEFAALLPHTSAEKAQELAQTLVERVRTHSPGSVTIGVSVIAPGQLGSDALQRADQALYRAKQHGGGYACEPFRQPCSLFDCCDPN
ncbi:PAS domain S-box protein [Mycobacterium sp. TY815]|uniref:sensor domain-containing diguanylate cyclase n=1 Tax=Mycobacterium sp. TY815 TaxID=3050581 RepID=UPI002740E3B2|nr:PAS domain S-box protein [Mycobacterium sp. TY815]MDP7701466.1 PAS domain S-box protein [Mycobacterium sp. TY815]